MFGLRHIVILIFLEILMQILVFFTLALRHDILNNIEEGQFGVVHLFAVHFYNDNIGINYRQLSPISYIVSVTCSFIQINPYPPSSRDCWNWNCLISGPTHLTRCPILPIAHPIPLSDFSTNITKIITFWRVGELGYLTIAA